MFMTTSDPGKLLMNLVKKAFRAFFLRIPFFPPVSLQQCKITPNKNWELTDSDFVFTAEFDAEPEPFVLTENHPLPQSITEQNYVCCN